MRAPSRGVGLDYGCNWCWLRRTSRRVRRRNSLHTGDPIDLSAYTLRSFGSPAPPAYPFFAFSVIFRGLLFPAQKLHHQDFIEIRAFVFQRSFFEAVLNETHSFVKPPSPRIASRDG